MYSVHFSLYKRTFYSQHANVVGTLSGHASWVLNVAFSPDGKYFVSGSSDRTVKVWELETKQCIHTFNEHTDQVLFSRFFFIPCIVSLRFRYGE